MKIGNRKSLKLSPLAVIRRGHYLYFARFWLRSRINDRAIAGKPLSSTTFNDNAAHYPVQSISYPYLEMLPELLQLSRDDCFVDIGCGYGRLLGYLSLNSNCGELVGIDLNAEAIRIARIVESRLNNVTILEGDATLLVPENATALFLFNPFDEGVLTAFLEKVEATCKKGTRVDYLFPEHERVFIERSRWRKVRTRELKPKHLGALRLVSYEMV